MNERIYREQDPFTEHSFILEYRGVETNRIVKRVIVDNDLEIPHDLISSDIPLRTKLVFNDVSPVVNSDHFQAILNVKKENGKHASIILDGSYSGKIHWGDGIIQEIEGNGYLTIDHVYSEYKVNTIKIEGSFESITLTSNALISVDSLGKLGLKKISFANSKNLTLPPVLLPETVEDLSYCFSNCKKIKEERINAWSFKNIKNMEGMFCYCKELTFELKDNGHCIIENMDKIFYASERCSFKIENVHFHSLMSLDGPFEEAQLPNWEITQSNLMSLRTATNLTTKAITVSEERSIIKLEGVTLGLETVDSLFNSVTNVDFYFKDIILPRCTLFKKIVSDTYDCNIRFESLFLSEGAMCKELVGYIEGKSIEHKNNVDISNQVLTNITEYENLLAEIKNCIVKMNFTKDVTIESLSLRNLIFNSNKSEINLGSLKIKHLETSNFIHGCSDTNIKLSLEVEDELSITELINDSDKVILDLSDSIFHSKVKYNTLISNSSKPTLTLNNVQHLGDVIYDSTLDTNDVTFVSTKNKYEKDLYIDALSKDNSVYLINCNDWEIDGNVYLFNLLTNVKESVFNIGFLFNNWKIHGKFNSDVLLKSNGKYMSETLRMFKDCILSRKPVSFKNWKVDGKAIFSYLFKDTSAVDTIDFSDSIFNVIELMSTFEKCNSSVLFNNVEFLEYVDLQSTFKESVSNNVISLKDAKFRKRVNFTSTFYMSSVNVDLTNMITEESLSFINTFERFGSVPVPSTTSITINGLATINTDAIDRVFNFMSYLGLNVTVNGLRALSMWNLKDTTLIVFPFLGANLGFEDPF